MLDFEIITDSQEVAKIVQGGPVSPHPIPPVATSYKNMELEKKKELWSREMQTGTRWQEIKNLCKQQEDLGKQRKAGTSRLTGNHTFWMIKFPEAKKGGEKRNLLQPKVTLCSLYSHYNKISLAHKKYPSCTDSMTLLI